MSRREVPWGMAEQPYSSPDYFPPSEVRWGLPLAALAVVLLPTSVFLQRWSAPPSIPLEGRDAIHFGIGLAFYASTLAVVIIASRRFGWGNLKSDFGLDFRPIDIVLGLGLWVIIEFLNRIATVIVVGVTGTFPDESSSNPHAPWVRVASGFLAVVAAPFIEELASRGLIMRAIRNSILRGRGASAPSIARRSAARILSIVASAILFSALHLPSRIGTVILPFELVATLLGGLLLGWVATRTGRLGPGILAHVAINVLAFALSP